GQFEAVWPTLEQRIHASFLEPLKDYPMAHLDDALDRLICRQLPVSGRCGRAVRSHSYSTRRRRDARLNLAIDGTRWRGEEPRHRAPSPASAPVPSRRVRAAAGQRRDLTKWTDDARTVSMVLLMHRQAHLRHRGLSPIPAWCMPLVRVAV